MATLLGSCQPTLWGNDDVATSPVTSSFVALDDTSSILHQPGWLRGADLALSELAAEVPWRTQTRVMYDSVVEVPRLSIAADPATVCATSTLGTIAFGVRDLIGAPIEHLGLNYYRSGRDSVAWHRDRIGRDRDWSVVALVSLGGPRRLSLRPWRERLDCPSPTRHDVVLHSGDLFVMAGACQRDWEHTVAKTMHASPRISVVVRTRQFPHGPLFQHAGVT